MNNDFTGRVALVTGGSRGIGRAKVLTPEQTQTVVDQTPIGGLGTPEEVAEVACFLLSERSRFMVGQTVSVCGGRIMIP